MSKLKTTLLEIWNGFLSLFSTQYKLIVSYNSIYGDADDQQFIVKKFFVKKDKYLKFKTDSNEIVEIRAAEGLNYRIQEL